MSSAREQDQTADVDRPGGADAPRRASRRPVRVEHDSPTTTAAKSGDRDGEHEQRPPAERADEQPADERTDRRARRHEHVEQAEGRAPPLGRRHRADQRDRARRDQRAARPPGGPGRARGPRTTARPPASSDASANATTPTRKTGRWPNRSPRLPLAGSATVTAPR